MFLWVVVAVHSLSFFFISCHYISSNSKSINFSTPPCCWAWKTYSHGSALGGVFPLEISPPSGCALFPSADSLCQWHQLLLETSWQKRERGKKKYLNSELSTSMTSDSMRLPNRIRHKQFSFPLKAFLKSIFHWRSHINTVLISSVLTVRQCVCVCVRVLVCYMIYCWKCTREKDLSRKALIISGDIMIWWCILTKKINPVTTNTHLGLLRPVHV